MIGPRIIAAGKSIATTGGHAIFTNGRKRDLMFDLGPEGGDGGGQIIAKGTPEQVAKMKQSHTGYFLKKMLG